MGWGYNRSVVKVDIDDVSVSINDQLVITTKVDGRTLQVTYHNDLIDLPELQNNAEVQALKGKSPSSLRRSMGRKGLTKEVTRAGNRKQDSA